jgi:CheY-like chemotaxis protein
VSTTLLAVDDSVTMRKVLEITFSGEEFRVITAENPDAALKKARSEKPALILLDVTLPGQDGYAVCKTLKAEVPGVPIIILSSKQGPYDAAKGSAAGADDFADKPFDTQQLIEKVKKAILNKGAARPAEAAPAPAAAPPAGASAARPGAGTIPGTQATPPAAPAAAAARPPQTQNFGSAPPRAATQPGSGTQPGATTKPATTPTLGHQPDNARTRTATGLGGAAVTATSITQQTPAQTAKPEAAAPAPAPKPEAAPAAAPPSPIAAAVDGQFAEKLSGLGLSPSQAEAVLALSREVVERVVWEVVPVLAETLIKEEIRRLTDAAE